MKIVPIERKYSLSEIDKMREYFKGKVDRDYWQTHDYGDKESRKLNLLNVEEQLRTAMMAGIDPEDCK